MNAISPMSRARAWWAANPQIIQTLTAFSIKIAGAGLSFGFNLLVARSFGPVGVGQFGLMLATLTLAATLCLVGLDYVLIRTVAGDLREGAFAAAKGVLRTVTLFVCCSALLMWGLLAIAGMPLLARSLGADATLVLGTTIGGVVPIALIRIVSSTLRSTGRVIFAQMLDGPMSMALSLAILGVLLAAGIGDARLAGGIYIGSITAAVLLGAAVVAHDLRRWNAVAVPVRAAPLLTAGAKIMIVILAGYASDWLILTSLARVSSPAEVGLYRTAWQIGTLFNLVVVAFDAVSGPRIAAAWRVGDRSGIARIWRQAIAVIATLSLPPLAVVVIVPEWILGLFGPEFVAASTALRILAAGQLINILTGPIGSILIMTGYERWSMGYSLVSLALTAVLAVVLMPMLGVEGAAITASVALAFRNLTALVLVWRFIGLRVTPR